MDDIAVKTDVFDVAHGDLDTVVAQRVMEQFDSGSDNLFFRTEMGFAAIKQKVLRHRGCVVHNDYVGSCSDVDLAED